MNMLNRANIEYCGLFFLFSEVLPFLFVSVVFEDSAVPFEVRSSGDEHHDAISVTAFIISTQECQW